MSRKGLYQKFKTLLNDLLNRQIDERNAQMDKAFRRPHLSTVSKYGKPAAHRGARWMWLFARPEVSAPGDLNAGLVDKANRAWNAYQKAIGNG